MLLIWLIGAILLAACGQPPEDDSPGPGGSGGGSLAMPLDVRASSDRFDAVALEWQLGEGVAAQQLNVLRDGEIVATLEPNATSYLDEGAAAGEVSAPFLEGVPAPGGVQLSWEISSSPGANHVYTVESVGTGSRKSTSEAAVGSRSSPALVGLTLMRDGEARVALDGVEDSYFDLASGAVVEAPVLEVSSSAAAVELSWDEPRTGAGNQSNYLLVAGFEGGLELRSAEVAPTPGAPDFVGWVVYRDGEEVGRLSGQARSFSDGGAAPGTLTAPLLSEGQSDAGAVELSWTSPVGGEGGTHRYTVEAIASGDVEVSSEEVVGFRSAPTVDRFEIRRDGIRLAAVDAAKTVLRDESALPGVVFPPAVTPGPNTTEVTFSWVMAEPMAGPLHGYVVRALGDGGASSDSNELQAGRRAPVVSGFVIVRDEEEVAVLDSESTDWVDEGAAPPSHLGEPLLAAQAYRLEGVMLRWSLPVGTPTQHSYQVRAATNIGPGPAATFAKGRRPIPSGYEIQKDGGEWEAVVATVLENGDLEYLDRDLPLGTITGTITVRAHPVLWTAEFQMDGFSMAPPPLTTYRVRAVFYPTEGEPSGAALARRSPGPSPTSWQWQRSAGASDADYTDIEGQEFSSGFDNTPQDGPRYYRLIMRSAGAAGVSEARSTVLDTFVQVASANQFSCGIRSSDGRRRCWGGSGAHGEAPFEPSTEAFTKLALGQNFGCGISSADGRVICWGENTQGQAPRGPSAEAYVDIDASYGYACGIRESDGQIECWGNPIHGQTPPLSAIDTFESLSVGMYHVCAIRQGDRKVLCWGDNFFGRAPPGPSEDSFIQLTSGKQHTCGIRESDHKVLCWGYNGYGESPRGPSATAYESIAAGDMNTCGIRLEDGLTVCWGMNDNCEAPPMPSLVAFDQVSGGFNHGCGIHRGDGRVTCWGLNTAAQAPAPLAAFPPCTPIGG